MKDWFKARNIWGAAISALSDEEAGRLAKAIWAFTMNGEIQEIEGAGKGILAMILLTLGQDAERDDEISVKRSMATAGIRNQKKSDDSKRHQMISSDIKSNQVISNDNNKNKNKNIDKEQEKESESEFIADADARQILHDHDRVLTAAEDAGFKLTNDVNAALIALYADFGLERVLEGIKSCSEHGAVNLAYLRACMKGDSKKPKAKVNAQDYEQRDYQTVQDEILRAQEERIAERLKGAS